MEVHLTAMECHLLWDQTASPANVVISLKDLMQDISVME